MSNLAGFRWHTGAELRRVMPEERLEPLFRDVGTDGLAIFLRGELRRLAGPMTPLTYTRTWRWQEPYVDHEQTGRLVLLCPRELQPWHSGVEHVFVGLSRIRVQTLGYVPGSVSLREAAEMLADAETLHELRECFGGVLYDERLAFDAAALDSLHREREASERIAAPLREALQGRDPESRDQARAKLERAGVSEDVLCRAFHHVPRAERAKIEALA